MKKRFKSIKKKRYYKFCWILLLLLIIIVDMVITNNISSSYIIDYSISNFKIDKKKLLLKLGLYEKEERKTLNVINELEEKKYIYLYNTHQTEEYSDSTVYEASLYMKDKLKEYNIIADVENTKIMDIINKNKMTYKDSYKITRSLLEENINKYDLFLDIHRDSSSKDVTTFSLNNKTYAKIMFVIGGNHDNYLINYNIASEINEIINTNYKGLSKGIYVRMSSNYNQDLANNILLIEIGGPKNTYSEVKNTIDILSDSINIYLGE